MWKFIKNLFAKKKQFTLDDFDLSRRLELKLIDEKKTDRCLVYFYHPITKKLWPMPTRKVTAYSNWTLLKQGILRRGDQMTIYGHWYGTERELRQRFQRVNDLKIYFDHLEQKYNELHP